MELTSSGQSWSSTLCVLWIPGGGSSLPASAGRGEGEKERGILLCFSVMRGAVYKDTLWCFNGNHYIRVHMPEVWRDVNGFVGPWFMRIDWVIGFSSFIDSPSSFSYLSFNSLHLSSFLMPNILIDLCLCVTRLWSAGIWQFLYFECPHLILHI
jgi:hypothetical protein